MASSWPDSPRSMAVSRSFLVTASATVFLVASGVASRWASMTKAAMPATWGAAAEVPKKGLKRPPGPVVEIPSNPITSGLFLVSLIRTDGPQSL